ncbi:family 43 glycosylhydrolase [Microbacterium panaciterrae]|uniref:Uncharacterized protein n=1 Tax=Microbacterium panaciterrae TaxID=985759 RepID=A0ABP8PR56_9MICO
MLLSPIAHSNSAAAAETTVTVDHNAITTTQGTPNLTYYSGTWASNTRIHWATTGSFFEIPFTGHTVDLYGSTRTDHGTGRVYVDNVQVGTVTYQGANNNTVRLLFTKSGLTNGPHTLRVEADGWVDHGWATFTATVAGPIEDDLSHLYNSVTNRASGDYTASSWTTFAAARTAAGTAVTNNSGTSASREQLRVDLLAALNALVDIDGLRDMVADYQTRVSSQYTSASWTPFAAAIAQAQSVIANSSASLATMVAAKNSLQNAAAGLVTTSGGTFKTITNDTWWNDTAGNPIYSQGGGVFKFGDTYYWYGVEYAGAALYRANPSTKYDNNVTFVSIPVYSSKDLASWKFENRIVTTSTKLAIPTSKGQYFAKMNSMADAAWVGRLGVSYNENTGKYVLVTQFNQLFDPTGSQAGGVMFLQGDSPTDLFDYGNMQEQIVNSPTKATGDQTVFTDDDGTDYLVFSNSSGRNRAFVSRLAPADSLSLEPGVQIGYIPGSGREGNAMFRMGNRYYMASSDLHGWNTSVNYVIQSQSSAIQGTYGSEFTMSGTEMDYSHVTQTGFFFRVDGTTQSTVVYAGDRWADFAWNGIGYNQWMPLTNNAGTPAFNSLSQWELNAVTGEWRVSSGNNYVLNPEFAADRVAVTTLTGWTNQADAGSTSAFVANVSPGAASSRWGLRLNATTAFSGAVQQTVTVPTGTYRFALSANTAGGLAYARAVIVEADGTRNVIDLNAQSNGWKAFSLSGITLAAGPVTIRIEAKSTTGNQPVTVDALSLVKTS